MNILAIDTSNQSMGVAIYKDDRIQAEYITNMKRNHSVGLMPAIDHIMNETDLAPQALDRIVVAQGPGSYTGIRIGLATAKTMAWSLNIPIVAVSSLELLAYNATLSQQLICPFFDARRGLVYTSLYEAENGTLLPKNDEENVLMTEWLEKMKQYNRSIVFLSQDIHLHQDTIEEQLGKQAIFPPEPNHLPRPGMLAKIGAEKPAVDVHGLSPNYIRLPEAEAKWLKEQEKQ
ncbi:M22 family peptidase [Gracilibacillus halophilus YIM-C55.5]|uniref:M22 family peptidase n=1 Tax=Gracilibacillus halophilus YIM-C55.5 TaxID=1308866 RepID=N4W814_9BACI|nr:tRNA (adenosine(37)-N6)-threonylcarbamoyltransferase complex dimerization subunit type 1 TsaB [Gracilibacillus halophilus]ENH96413.1 M22 family peptidase [Gracilibacillus halophilus YIM-C55.5]